jgi:hypothetical protein
VTPTQAVGVADIIGHAVLVISEVGLAALTERAKKQPDRRGLEEVTA